MSLELPQTYADVKVKLASCYNADGYILDEYPEAEFGGAGWGLFFLLLVFFASVRALDPRECQCEL